MAETYALRVVQGETLIRDFSAVDDGSPFDFTLYTIEAQIRDRESTTGTLLLNLSPWITKADGGLTLHMRVPANVTSEVNAKAMNKPTASFDIFAIETADPTNGQLILEGSVTCNAAVTDTGEEPTP